MIIMLVAKMSVHVNATLQIIKPPNKRTSCSVAKHKLYTIIMTSIKRNFCTLRWCVAHAINAHKHALILISSSTRKQAYANSWKPCYLQVHKRYRLTAFCLWSKALNILLAIGTTYLRASHVAMACPEKNQILQFMYLSKWCKPVFEANIVVKMR